MSPTNLSSIALGSLAFASIRSVANPFFASLFRSSSFLTHSAANLSALIGEVLKERMKKKKFGKELSMADIEAFIRRYAARPSYTGRSR